MTVTILRWNKREWEETSGTICYSSAEFCVGACRQDRQINNGGRKQGCVVSVLWSTCCLVCSLSTLFIYVRFNSLLARLVRVWFRGCKLLKYLYATRPWCFRVSHIALHRTEVHWCNRMCVLPTRRVSVECVHLKTWRTSRSVEGNWFHLTQPGALRVPWWQTLRNKKEDRLAIGLLIDSTLSHNKCFCAFGSHWRW